MARDILGRIPFASVIATFICLIGVGLFCGTLFTAVDTVLRGIFEELFRFTIPWLNVVQILFIVVACVMGCYAILLLVFGILATGATREDIYSGAKCIMGGRVSAAFFMTISYVLNAAWMGITATLGAPIIIYVMLRSICYHEIERREHWDLENYCLNLTRFGIYRSGRFPETIEPVDGSKNAICDPTELGRFCQLVHDAGQMFAFALGGSFLIVLAMIFFLMILSTNYARIKSSKELTEYRDAVDLEMREGADMNVVANKNAIADDTYS